MTTPASSSPSPAVPTPSAPLAERRGRFVWHDYMTPDVAKAQAFYEAVIGWGAQDFGAFDYRMFTMGGVPLGGYGPFTDDMRAAGTPPHWISYVGVEDVDAAARDAEALGARILAAEDIPQVGRFAIMRDPQGAYISLYRGDVEMPEPAEPMTGDVSWHELWVPDNVAAQAFYAKLFGWESAGEFEDPQIGVYRMFGRRGMPLGGMATLLPEMKDVPPNWLPYFKVDDLDAAVGRARREGGTVIVGPMEVPGGGRVAQCFDSLGGAFALHQP